MESFVKQTYFEFLLNLIQIFLPSYLENEHLKSLTKFNASLMRIHGVNVFYGISIS